MRLWVWAAALVWMTEPLQTLLSGVDPALPASVQNGSPYCRYIRYAVGLVALAAALARAGAAARLARTAWPLLLFLAYAAASAAWSQDRTASARALLAGAPLLAFALALGATLRPARALQAVLLALAASVLASVAAVALVPHHAVAGAHDALGASAEGDWRGLYLHKNALGHLAGLTAGLLLSGPGRLLAPGRLRLGAATAAVVCVIGARSASGPVLALGLLAIDRWTRPRGLPRLALAGFTLAFASALLAARESLFAAGLQALGRDATLSGRLDIWGAAWALGCERALTGWGIDYSVSPDVAARLTSLFGVNHVHNAALDVFVNLGAAGLVLLVVAVVSALGHAGRGGLAARGLGLAVFGWLISGLSEDMGVRAEGPIAAIGLVALVSLYGVGAPPGSAARVVSARAPRPAPSPTPRVRP